MVEWQSADQEVRGLNSRSAKIFSIYLNEELNHQKVDKKNKNKNSSNFLVFDRWPQTQIDGSKTNQSSK